MFNWYEVEISLQEHYKDLLREVDEKARARIVPGQRRQRKSLLQALTQQVRRATASPARTQRSPHPA